MIFLFVRIVDIRKGWILKHLIPEVWIVQKNTNVQNVEKSLWHTGLCLFIMKQIKS